jgi:O-antigen ligase
VGVGDIDLGNLYRKYKDAHLKENFGHLHNNFMQWLVTLGIVGFIAVLFLMVSILRINAKIYSEVKDEPFASSFALGSIASFIGFLASGLGEYNFGDQEIITMVWFSLGLNLAFYINHQKKQKSEVA